MRDSDIIQWNPVCKVGDDFTRYLQVIDPNTNLPVTDYTGWSFFAGIKETADSEEYVHQMSLGNGFSLTEIDGQAFVVFKIPRSVTGQVSIDLTPRPGGNFPEKLCLIDIVAQDAVGEQTTGAEGVIIFRYRVTA